MKALTIRQPHASLIMIGGRDYHFAVWWPSARLIGERIVIYADAAPVRAVLRTLP